MFKLVGLSVSASTLLLASGMAQADASQEAFLSKDLDAQVENSRLIEPCIHPLSIDRDRIDRIDDIVPIDDCGPGGGGGGGGNTGPRAKPSVPGDIDYAAFAMGSFKVTWTASNGNGATPKYELFERKDNGPWTKVYNGYGRSYTVSNRGNGRYTYRVRATNAKGASGYASGTQMAIDIPAPVVDPAFNAVMARYQQADNAFITSNPKYIDPLARKASGSRLRTYNAGEFNLGRGFGVTEGNYAPQNLCLEPDGLSVKVTPADSDTWFFERVDTSEDLYSKLDLDISADLSLSIKAFDASISTRYELFRESQSQRKSSRLVVKWTRKAEQLDLIHDDQITLKSDLVDTYIKPYDGANITETNFRNQCGDKYVGTVVNGASLIGIIEIDNKKLSSTELSTVTWQVESKFKKIFEFSSNGTISTEDRRFFEQHNVKVRFTTEGGSNTDEKITVYGVSQFKNFVDGFIANVDPDRYVAVQKSLMEYPIPTQYVHLNHMDVFEDYRDERYSLTQWLALDHQFNERCEGLEKLGKEYGVKDFKDTCQTSRTQIAPKILDCSRGVRWTDCVSPNDTNLVDEFYQDIPSLYTFASLKAAQSEIDLHVKKKARKSPSWGWDNAYVCLPQAFCIIDESQQQTPENNIPNNIAPPGVRIVIDALYNSDEAKGYQTIEKNYENKLCLRTRIGMKPKKKFLGKTESYYRGTQSIHGRCPANKEFNLP